MVFAGYSGFLHYLQLDSHELATIGINVTRNEIQIQINSNLRPVSVVRETISSWSAMPSGSLNHSTKRAALRDERNVANTIIGCGQPNTGETS